MKKFSLSKKQLYNTYGNDFSKMDLFITSLGLLLVIGITCYVHRLNVLYSSIVIVTGLICEPIILTSYFKYTNEKNRFEDYCMYFEYMKMYYKTYHKISIALEMTLDTFKEKSKMKELILNALEEIKTTGNYEKALSYIDKEYHNTYLERLHTLMILGEKQGGQSVYENLDKINYLSWKEDITIFQKRKKANRYLLYFFLFICLCMSVYTVYIFDFNIETTSMIEMLTINAKYQLYTLIELECILIVFIYAYCELVNKKWIRSDE